MSAAKEKWRGPLDAVPRAIAGRLPGLVALIGRRGEEHVDAIGTLAFDRPAPMRRDSIF